MNIVFEICGWIGASLLLFAYYLSIKKKNTNAEGDSNNEFLLSLINLIGSLLLMGNAIFFKVYPFVLVNTFWAILSMKELVKISKEKKSNK